MRFSRDKLLSPEQLSHNTGWSLKTLANRRSLGKAPRYIKCGAKIWYLVEDFENFMEASHALAESEREMALAIPGRRHNLPRQDRFGRNTTQSERRA